MPDLIPVDEKTAQEIQEMLPADLQEAINIALIKQAFLIHVNKKTGEKSLYVRRPGLLIFMEKKFRPRAKYTIRTEIPSQEEEERIRKMMGIKNGDSFVVMKGVVEIEYEDGKKETFVDFGTASPQDCYHNRLIEMASTRATNRAMRLATSLGFTSVEELPEKNETSNNQVEKTKNVVEAETIDPDTPFEKLPNHTRIKILAETDKLFRQIAFKESDRRGEHITIEQIKQEFLEEFGVSSRKEMTYGQLRELWKKARERLKELEQEELEEIKQQDEAVQDEELEALKNIFD